MFCLFGRLVLVLFWASSKTPSHHLTLKINPQTHFQQPSVCKGTIKMLLFVSYIPSGYLILSLWHGIINIPLPIQIKLIFNFYPRNPSLSFTLQLKIPNTTKPTDYSMLSPSFMTNIFLTVIKILSIYQLQTGAISDPPIQGVPWFCRFALNNNCTISPFWPLLLNQWAKVSHIFPRVFIPASIT